MLQLIRGKVGSWVIKILFVLLAVGLAGFGITNVFSSGGVRATVATVGDQRITVEQLNTAFQAELGRLQRVFGPSLDLQLALSLGLLDQAMDTLVDNSLLDQAASSLGLQPSDAMIAAAIQQEPAFQDATGQFSRDQFERFLRVSGLDEPSFVAQRRSELGRVEVVGAIAAGVAVPDTLAGALHRFRNETRHIAAVLIGPDTIGDIAPPTDEQVEAYYRENEQSFLAPEYRVLRVVSLTASDIAEEIEIPEDDLLAEYDLRLDEYETPERRAFEQIVVPDEAAAAQVSNAASGGLSLAESVEAVDGVEASVITLQLAPQSQFFAGMTGVAEAGFALVAGGTSAPVQSQFGWHVLQVTEIVEGGLRSYESARPEIEAEFKLEEALDQVPEIANDLDDLLASDVALDEAARQLGLPVTVTRETARDGSLRDGGVLEDLPNLPEVLQTGFGLSEGATSLIETTADENYFVVRVERVMAPALRSVDTVRESIVAAWTAQQASAAAQTLAEATAERLDANAPVADIAAEIGAIMVEQSDLRRDGANRGTLPESLVQNVFQIAVGDVALSPTEDGYIVARLETVNPAPATDQTALQDLATGQTQAITGDLLAGFAQSLRLEFDVDIDRTAMSRLYQQEPR